MRKLPAAAALIGLLALPLAGCSALSGDDFCERPSSDLDLASLVEVSGAFGSLPEIETLTPLRTTVTESTDLIRGSGLAVTTETQLMTVEISFFSAETGDFIVSTNLNGDLSLVSNVKFWTSQFPGLEDTLTCATESSRILSVLGPEQVGQYAQSRYGIGADESVIVVQDILKVYLPRATGTPVFNAERGLPVVVNAPSGQPGIVVPETDPPGTLVRQVLIQGDGPAVSEDQVFRAHYSVMTWSGRTVFASTWDDIPGRVKPSEFLPGAPKALAGLTVGSQALLIVPPEFGYGDEARPNIPAGSTLVIVIDVLGIEELPK